MQRAPKIAPTNAIQINWPIDFWPRPNKSHSSPTLTFRDRLLGMKIGHYNFIAHQWPLITWVETIAHRLGREAWESMLKLINLAIHAVMVQPKKYIERVQSLKDTSKRNWFLCTVLTHHRVDEFYKLEADLLCRSGGGFKSPQHYCWWPTSCNSW